MNRKHTLRSLLMTVGMGHIACLLFGAISPSVMAAGSATLEKPNFIIIFTDDQGYQDLGCFGSPKIKTPRIDQLAAEGMKFTSFYAQTVCGPSRAALMTGSYPLRVAKKNNRVDIHPFLHTNEVTIAEVLKPLGYKSGCFGKWDLAGHRQKGYAPELLPLHQGFDYFFGTPTSNDSTINIIKNDKVIEKGAEMALSTKRYTDEALGFIRRNSASPFFVYIPYTMPHTILGASKNFLGKSERGLYGDVIEEIDFNVGRIVDLIKELKLESTTYIIYVSDNGPWHLRKEHGGSALPLRGAKTSTWEGGLRVPCVMWAPERIPAGRSVDALACTMDLLPTIAALSGGKVPNDRVIDGNDISELMHGKDGAVSKKKAFYYYQDTHLQAVRSGKWKLHVARTKNPRWGSRWDNHIKPEDVIAFPKPMLFDLEADIAESTDLASANPEVVTRLLALLEDGRNDIGDYDRAGKNARFFDPQPHRPDTAKWLK